MKKLQYHAHTADSLSELFEAGLEGMSGILKEGICNGPKPVDFRKRLSVEAAEITTLMIDFLSEVLTLSHIHCAVFCALNIEVLNSRHLKGDIAGYRVDHFDDDIKAVTYHEAEVVQDQQQNWSTNIIFDI